MSFLNPFNELFETTQHPDARTLRTTFLGKVWDTFKAFFGHLNETKEKKAHIGIYDIPTLGITYFLSKVILDNLEHIKSNPLKWVAAAVLAIMTIPRAGIAVLMTLISLPFITFAHALVKDKGDKLKEKVLDYVITKEQYDIKCVERFELGKWDDKHNRYPVVNARSSLVYNYHLQTLHYVDFLNFASKIDLKEEQKALLGNYFQEGNNIIVNKVKPITKDKLLEYVAKPEQLNTSIKVILDNLRLSVEDITASTVSKTDDNSQKTFNIELQDGQKSPIAQLSLFTSKADDCALLDSLVRLNVGNVGHEIEMINEREQCQRHWA